VNFTFTSKKFLFDFSIEKNAEIKQIILPSNAMLFFFLIPALIDIDLKIRSSEFCLAIGLVPVRLL